MAPPDTRPVIGGKINTSAKIKSVIDYLDQIGLQSLSKVMYCADTMVENLVVIGQIARSRCDHLADMDDIHGKI